MFGSATMLRCLRDVHSSLEIRASSAPDDWFSAAALREHAPLTPEILERVPPSILLIWSGTFELPY
jgi:hypothetical protein